MIKKYIEKIIDGEDLTFGESHDALSHIMQGEISDAQTASLLTALKMKGEAPSELAGFVRAMRSNSRKLQHDLDLVIDVCGTGGDNSGTFNISTAASFVVAAAGVAVAKHGNTSISSKSGSADVLEALGVNTKLSTDLSRKSLEEVGITFLFAPQYHPAMKHVAPVRKSLGFKTIFNMLGPLTNPAQTQIQMVGTFDQNAALKMRNALKYLEAKRFLFVNTLNKFDEVTLTGKTRVYEFNSDSTNNFNLNPEDFNYPTLNLSSLQGSTSVENAKIIYNLLEGAEKTPAYYVVAANAALALFTSGICNDISSCKLMAEEAIDSRKALLKLEELKKVGA